MRHRKAGRKFKRSPSHRRMLLRNLATSLLEHGRIETTLAKAKEVQPFVEKLITLARDGWNLNNFRRVLAVLTKKDVAFQLFNEIGPRSRTGRAATPASTSSPRSARATPPRWRVISPAREPTSRSRRRPSPAVVAAASRLVTVDRSGQGARHARTHPMGCGAAPGRRSARRRRTRRVAAHPAASLASRLPLLQDRPRRDPLGHGPRDRRRRRLPRHPSGEPRPRPARPQGAPRPPRRAARRPGRARRHRSCRGSAGPSRPPPAPTG